MLIDEGKQDHGGFRDRASAGPGSVALRLKEQSGDGRRDCCSVTDGAVHQPGRRGDGNAPGFTYTRALAAFARRGPGTQARALLREARELNPHIPAYLTGRKKLPRRRPAYTVFGEESEAVDYAAGAGELWATVPGALAWLQS